jgi:hypothetical protein
MTASDVRDRLTHALRLDLIGPEPDQPQVDEILDRAPSRWYLTGFLAPSNAPASQKSDETDPYIVARRRCRSAGTPANRSSSASRRSTLWL